MCTATGALGISRRAFLEAVIHCSRREAFGNRLINCPRVQETLLDMITDIEDAWALTAQMILTFDRVHTYGEATSENITLLRLLLAMAKYRCSENGVKHAREAMELHGGNGYIEEFVTPLNDILNQYDEKGYIEFDFLFWKQGSPANVHSYYAIKHFMDDDYPKSILPFSFIREKYGFYASRNFSEEAEKLLPYLQNENGSETDKATEGIESDGGTTHGDKDSIHELTEQYIEQYPVVKKWLKENDLDWIKGHELELEEEGGSPETDIYNLMQKYIKEHANYVVAEAKKAIIELSEEKSDQFNPYSFYFRGSGADLGFSDEQYAEALLLFDHVREELLQNPAFRELYELECDSCRRLKRELTPEDEQVARERKYFLVYILRPSVMEAQDLNRIYHRRMESLEKEWGKAHAEPKSHGVRIGSHLNSDPLERCGDRQASKHTAWDIAQLIRGELRRTGQSLSRPGSVRYETEFPRLWSSRDHVVELPSTGSSKRSWADVVRGSSRNHDDIPRAGSSRDHEAQKGTDGQVLGDR